MSDENPNGMTEDELALMSKLAKLEAQMENLGLAIIELQKTLHQALARQAEVEQNLDQIVRKTPSLRPTGPVH